MRHRSTRASAPGSDCPACRATSSAAPAAAHGLEPTRLEAEAPHAPGCPEHPRSVLGSLAGRVFLASIPALAVPGCFDAEQTLETSVGLDNGTVGAVVDPDSGTDRAA